MEPVDFGDLCMIIDFSARGGRGEAVMACPARTATARQVTAMALHARGLVSVAMDEGAAFRRGLKYMAAEITPGRGASDYLASIEAASCDGTGISAADRALTIRTAGNPKATARDFRCPGHVMPMVVDPECEDAPSLPALACRHSRQSWGSEVVAWCSVLDEDGELAGSDHALALARRLSLPVVPAKSIVHRRRIDQRRPARPAPVLPWIAPVHAPSNYLL